MQEAFDFLASKSGLILSVLVVLFVLERLFPVAKALGGIYRIVKNLVLASFNFVFSPLVVIPVSAFAAQWQLPWRPEWWSGWGGFAADVLILDCWIYLWHRANHEVQFLWRFHEVHHLDETLDTTSALRFHFGEVLLSSAARAVLIFLLAVPLSSIIAFEAMLAVAALFHHSNLKLPPTVEHFLSLVVVTPSIHWVHHHAIRRDTDSNYSTVFSWWDRLFRSKSTTARWPAMPVGVEGRRDTGLARLVFRPFRRG
jgi:sterol desaturase/sphingolipid hydroxylase (fatty acid hydroxylase superfamily)